MKITKQIIEKHGLNDDEFENIKKLLKEILTCLSLEFFQQCGMNIAHINRQEYILKASNKREAGNSRAW